MGIISDFQELNREIEECNSKTSVFKIATKIKLKFQKKKLLEIDEKLRNSNAPLTKDDLVELARSIYSNCIPDGIFKNVKVSYYNRSGSYRMFVDVNQTYKNYRLISSLVEVSPDEKTIHITISTEDLKNEITNATSVTCKDFSTNVKEIKNDVATVNSILIKLMADYILENIG